ncbi:MAG: LysM peptidoglycan-binding domain-containing protein [Clostridia bacterium]|nr:LysM peptidoglycan-binding domain-containing protein [Clostridia bacterium]
MKNWAFEKIYKKPSTALEQEKLSDKVFLRKIAASFLTILACTVVLAASTLARFYTDVSTENSRISGAYYSVTVNKTKTNTYICPLVFEDKHTFEIKADGNAATGYCKIQIGSNIYYTEQINRGETLLLTVIAAKGTVISFTPQWGTSSYYVTDGICPDTINHSVTPSASYIVEVTAKLSDIAAYYGVPEVDILTYNGISKISVGDELKIPGAESTVKPYAVDFALLKIEERATIEGIAGHYGISAADILLYNNISAIQVDTVIKIPGVPADTEPYVAPKPDPLNNEYYQITTLNKLATEKADLLVYHGNEFDKTKDTKIFNLECNKDGQYFFDIKNKTKTVSLCFAITENTQQCYLKIVIDGAEYYSVPIVKDSYVRLDVAANIGSKIRIEVYEGAIDSELGVTEFYGDDLENDVNEKNMKLDHAYLS